MPTPTLTQSIVITLIQCLLVVIFVFVVVPLTVFAERKVLGYLQQRLGSTRVASGHVGITGWMNRGMWKWGRVPVLSYWRGIPGLVADVLKLILKEDILPAKADKFVFFIAPAISMVAAVVVFAAVSFVPGVFFIFPTWFPYVGGLPVSGGIADINVGLLWILGVASVGVYGIVLAGWASNSKYPLLGGLRSAAQMVSYEVPLAMSLLAPVVLSASLNFGEMSARMAIGLPFWGLVPQILGFLIYLTCGFAETNRLPFDMPEAENELVAGFHTEYSGMKFAFYFLAEYANMVVISSIATVLFLGGWLPPFPNWLAAVWALPALAWIPPIAWFVLKMAAFLFVYIWFRGTFPRYRFDQLMDLGWKVFIPVSLVNLMAVALGVLLIGGR